MSPERVDISASPADRPLTVREAFDALDAFGKGAGRVPLLLLLHASVPQSFRADLLNLLKANFLATEAAQDLTIDVDVLFSTLVHPAAAGYFRLDPEVRRHGLALLDAEYRHHAERRSVQVARLLLAYADAVERDAGQALDAMLAEYLAIQRWVALAFIDPAAAAELFARAISEGVEPHGAAVSLRLGSVTAAVSIPLTGHRELLAYARGIEAIATGDTATGRRLLDGIGDEEVRVGEVTLRTGPAARQQRVAESQDASPTSGPSTSDARAQPGGDLVFISYARHDRQAAKDIARALEDQGIAVWIDLEETGFRGDRELQVRGTIEAIDRCTLFLPLISRHSLAIQDKSAPRYQWNYALERFAKLEDSAAFSICPVAIDDSSSQSPGVPAQMRGLRWASVVGEERGGFVQSVKLQLALQRAGRSSLKFGVLNMPPAILGRDKELRELESALTFMVPPPPGIPRPLSPTTVALTGANGAGKWTLACQAVHGVADRFPDGVIWFDDDVVGNSRTALRAYAEALGITGLFGEDGVADVVRFQEVFATRRVLFVEYQRSAFDLLPTLAGPMCVVLKVVSSAPTDASRVVHLSPLSGSDSAELLNARAGRTVSSPEILAFAAGNPLLLLLLGGAIAIGSESEVLAYLRRNKRPGGTSSVDPKVRWLVEYLWPSHEVDMGAVIAAAGNSTQVAISRLPFEWPATLERAGLLNIHADMVRVPPDVAHVVRELMRSGSRPAQQQQAAPQPESAPPDSPNIAQPPGSIAIPPIQIARDLIAKGALAKAQGTLEERLRLCEQTGNRPEQAITLGDLATVAVQRDAFERALELQRVRVIVYEDLGDQSGIAAALTEIGIIHRRRGAFADAVPAFERALAIYERVGDRLSAAKILRVLGSVAGDSERFEDAFRLLERALALFESSGQHEGLIGRAETFGDLAALAFGEGQHQRAIGFAQQRLALAGRLSDDREQLAALEQAGEITAQSGNPQQGASYLEEARTLAFATNDIVAEVRILANLGRLRAAVGDIEQALALFEAAWTRAQSGAINFPSLAESYGSLLFATGRRPLATTVLEEARHAYEHFGQVDDQRRIEKLLTAPDTEETRQALLADMRAWIQAPPAGP